MEAAQRCAICCVGPSSDRTLLECGNSSCSSGSWFHSRCLGAAIINRNMKKARSVWLCPWCVLSQTSSLSERQLLALTLQTSLLDNLRKNNAASRCQSSSLEVTVASEPTLGTSGSIKVRVFSDMEPHLSLSNGVGLSTRGFTALHESHVSGSGQNDYLTTCAKCRRA
jgi:hypothetical protein